MWRWKLWCKETRTSLFSSTTLPKLLIEPVVAKCVSLCAYVLWSAFCPACQYLSVLYTHYRRLCITMDLNNHVWYCVLTLIYSLYK